MKILLAGMFNHNAYEPAFADALEYLGHTVIRFRFLPFFSSLMGKLELHYNKCWLSGRKMNKRLIKKIQEANPDIVLIWRGTHILPKTLHKIKEKNPNTIITSYNNDDPFSILYNNSFYLKNLWKRFIKTIPFYDINFVFRSINISDYNRVGSKKTQLMMMYFNEKDVQGLTFPSKFTEDVIFLGYFEENRLEIINYLLDHGINVRVFGSWDVKKLSNNYKHDKCFPIFDKNYFTSINQAKIVLCFFSKLNRDQYTIRSFEIPGAKGLILSERTDLMMELYKENEEAVFFSSKEECLQKVKWLLDNPEICQQIRQKGNRKVYDIGGEVKSRAKDFVHKILNEQVS